MSWSISEKILASCSGFYKMSFVLFCICLNSRSFYSIKP